MPTDALYYFEEAHRIHPDPKVAKKVAMLHERIRLSAASEEADSDASESDKSASEDAAQGEMRAAPLQSETEGAAVPAMATVPTAAVDLGTPVQKVRSVVVQQHGL